jgi:hypothetical protein
LQIDQISLAHLLKRLFFSHCTLLLSLSKIYLLLDVWVYFWLSVLFHWLLCILFCHYYALIIGIALWYRSQVMWRFQLYSFYLWFLWLIGAFCGSLWSLRLFLSISVENIIGIMIEIVLIALKILWNFSILKYWFLQPIRMKYHSVYMGLLQFLSWPFYSFQHIDLRNLQKIMWWSFVCNMFLIFFFSFLFCARWDYCGGPRVCVGRITV